MNDPVLAAARRAAFVAAVTCIGVTTASAAVVRTIDGATLTGSLVSLADGKLTVAATKPATGPAAAPASMWEAPPAAAVGPVAVPLTDVLDVDPAGGPPPSTQPSTQPSAGGVGDVWLLTLADGSRMHGQVDRWAGGRVDFRPAVAVGGATVDLPGDQLVEAWGPSAGYDEAARAKALTALPADAADAADAADVAMVRRDGDAITAVRGTVVGLNGDALVFRFDGKDRRIAVAKLVGVRFARRAAPTAGPHFVAHFAGGDAVAGQWVDLADDWVTLRPTWGGGALSVGLAGLSRLASVGGRLTYVSDLTPAKVEQVGYFGRVVPYRLDGGLAGGPIKLADGTTYAKGVAVHARCVLDYDLGGGYQRFKATVGFERPAGTAAVRVVADGRVAYDAPAARGDRPPVAVDVDVTGVRRLSLVVDFAGDDGDAFARVDWADARLLRAKTGGR